MASGTALSQILYISALPFITRLYDASQVGDLIVFQAILSIATIISSMRYEIAILAAPNQEEASNVLALSMLIALLSSSILALITCNLPRIWTLPAGLRIIHDYWWVLLIGQVGSAWYQIILHSVLRHKAFNIIAMTKVTQVAVQLACQILFGLGRLNHIGLILGDALGRNAGVLNLIRMLWKNEKKSIINVTLGSLSKVAKQYKRYPLFSFIAGLLYSLCQTTPPLLLAPLYGASIAGWYGLMTRVCSAPFMLIAKGVADVYASKCSELARNDPPELLRLLRSALKKLIIISLLLGLAIILLAPRIFAFCFGNAWEEAGVYAQCAVLSIMADFCLTPFLGTLNILEKQHLQFAWDMVLFMAIIGGTLSIFSMGGSAKLVIFYMATSRAIMLSLHVFTSYYIIRSISITSLKKSKPLHIT